MLEGLCKDSAMTAAATLGWSGCLSPLCCGEGPSIKEACAAGALAARRGSLACWERLVGVLEGGLQGAPLPSWGACVGLRGEKAKGLSCCSCFSMDSGRPGLCTGGFVGDGGPYTGPRSCSEAQYALTAELQLTLALW